MKIYLNDATDPYFNLAVEEYLLENTDDDVFMLWQNEPSVIIGKNQNAFAEVELDYIRANRIKLVRRLTGGGAVFHDLGNVNYTFISFAEEGEGIDFERFTAPIISILHSLGVDAHLSGRNDITVSTPDGERKLSGSAQCRRTRADGRELILHHGTLLCNVNLTRLAASLKPKPEKLKSKGIASVSSRVANLTELVEDAPDAELLIGFIAAYAIGHFGAPLEALPDEMLFGIRQLAFEKYATDEWNLRRMASFELSNRRRFDFGEVGVGVEVGEGRIVRIEFDGDFFGELDIAELEAELIGCEYSREAVTARLSRVGRCISGADAESITELIVV